jgi:hypothetical protein
MAEEQHDVHFESADAGASLTYPQQAGTIRKNGFIVIKGRPCKVRNCFFCLLNIFCTSISLRAGASEHQVW